MSNGNRMNTDTIICPCCGEEIKATAKKCKHCGEWLTKEDANSGCRIGCICIILVFIVGIFILRSMFQIALPWLDVTGIIDFILLFLVGMLIALFFERN